MEESYTPEDVSPQCALKNLDLMHNYLQKRLSSITGASDLIPYINVLLPLNNLKIQLSSLLHQQFKSQKELQNENEKDKYSPPDKIRSLYIRLCSLNGIPSDVLHAKIISFLPSSEYKKLPMLSTHFRMIMNRFPFIYNHKKYSVELLLKNRAFSSQSYTNISILHNTKNIIIKPLISKTKTKITKKSDSIIATDNNLNISISRISFPLYDIHIYKIYCESVADWLWVGSEYRNQSDDETSDNGFNNTYNNNNAITKQTLTDNNNNESILSECTDNYNITNIKLLSRANNSIKHLCIENIKLNLQKYIFNNKHTFNQCLILNIRHSPTYNNILSNLKLKNQNTFCKLQYLELWYPKQDKLLENKICETELLETDPANLSHILDDRQLDQFYAHIARKKVLCEAINKILLACAETLIAFVYHDDNESEILSWGWCTLMLEHLNNSQIYKGILSIPGNCEWLSLRNSCFITDLNKCHKLIGCEILGDTHYNDIKWPQNYIIPYSYLSPQYQKKESYLNINHWKNMLIKYNNKDENNQNEFEYQKYIPNTKFICLGKRISRATPSLKFSWDPELDDLNEIVDDDSVGDKLIRYKINKVMIKEINSKKYQMKLHKNGNNISCCDMKEKQIDNLYLPEKCLLIDKSDMNKDLFQKIMIYKYNQNEEIRLNKIEMYTKWWDLGAGIWIKNIGIIEKWNGRSKKKSSYWSVTDQ